MKYDDLVKRLHQRIALTAAGSPLQDDLQKAADAIEELMRRCEQFQYMPQPTWIPVSERLPSKEERKEWIDNNLDGIGYLYPCLVTRYSSINPDRAKNNPYVAKHYFDGKDFLNEGEEVCSEYIIAWMPLPKSYKDEQE